MSIKKLLILVVASTSSTVAFAATPTYTATFAGPATLERVVSSERLWACEGNLCLAGGEATSPARNICARLAREIGPVTSFSFKGRALGAEQIARCNERAGHSLAPAAAK